MENSRMPSGPVGPKGWVGPNDNEYIHRKVVEAAKAIKAAQELYSQGHYAHSNAKVIPITHPLRLVMEELAKLDREYAIYSNSVPNDELFSTYEPPIGDTTRWDRKQGPVGIK